MTLEEKDVREAECHLLHDRLEAVIEELDPDMNVALSVLTVLSAETLAAAGDYDITEVPAMEFIAYLSRIVHDLCAAESDELDEDEDETSLEMSEVKPANIITH